VTETVFNIFLDFKSGRCQQARYVAHDLLLNDVQAVAFLQQRVDIDLLDAMVVQLAAPFTKAQYDAHCRLGRGHELYDDVFREVGAGPEPLFVTTPVVDGRITIDDVGQTGEHHSFLTPELLRGGQMRDWLTHYIADGQLDIPQLIHDDFFIAIKLTFNAKLYASSMKLLLSCIDSIAFIEFGDVNGKPAFVRWLEAYADLAEVSVTAEELWELRNGLLHMTSLSSRKVTAQKVRRISFRFGGVAGDEDGIFYFEVMSLINAYRDALERWLRTYNDQPDKFVLFVERYDETISDSRLMIRPAPSPDRVG